MAVLDTNVVIERIKRREEIRENTTAVTFVEYPKIVYYKKFYGKILFPDVEDFMLAHKTQNKLLVGQSKNICRFAYSVNLHKQKRGADN